MSLLFVPDEYRVVHDDEEDDEGCCGDALLGCIMAFAASFLALIAFIEGTKFVAWLWRVL